MTSEHPDTGPLPLRLLIVDEPTVGLDPEERVRFRNLLSDLAGERLVILSTHIVSDVEAIATEIAVIAGGQLLAYNTPEALLADASGQVWEWVVPANTVPDVRTHHLVSGMLRSGSDVRLRVIAPAAPAPEAIHPVVSTSNDGFAARLTR